MADAPQNAEVPLGDADAVGDDERTHVGSAAGLTARLEALRATPPPGGFKIRDLFRSLSGRGHAALVVVLALPFCLPVPLFGLSVLFGAVLAFVGLRISFGRRPWLPRWVLDKPMHAQTVDRLAEKTARLEKRLRRFVRPRYVHLCRNRGWHVSHGLTIAVMGLLLALPLPIPFSNIPAALPILILGLGLLEDDGVFVVIGYAAAWVGVATFVAIAWFGGVGLEKLMGVFGWG